MKTDQAILNSQKHLVFNMKTDLYSIPLSLVKEVIALPKITLAPNMPKFFMGLINLRGRVISVIDLRSRVFQDEAFDKTQFHNHRSAKPCVIISEVENQLLGMVVDDVNEVLNIPSEKIEKQLRDRFVIGVVKMENKPMILVLNLVSVLNIQEVMSGAGGGQRR